MAWVERKKERKKDKLLRNRSKEAQLDRQAHLLSLRLFSLPGDFHRCVHLEGRGRRSQGAVKEISSLAEQKRRGERSLAACVTRPSLTTNTNRDIFTILRLTERPTVAA